MNTIQKLKKTIENSIDKWKKTTEQSKKTIEQLKKTMEKMKNTMEKLTNTMEKLTKTMEKSMNILENSMKIMQTSMKTMENSINTMENSWNHWKNWRTVRMRDFSYKMQQMRDFSCKNQGREPGRQKKNAKKKCQLNFAPLIQSSFMVSSIRPGKLHVLWCCTAARQVCRATIRICSHLFPHCSNQGTLKMSSATPVSFVTAVLSRSLWR